MGVRQVGSTVGSSEPWKNRGPFPRSPSYQSSWIEATFVDGEAAEDALCNDRPSFVVRNDIMSLIPRNIRRCLAHSADLAQIEGFQDLFIYLNDRPGAHELRRLVIAYFRSSPCLRGHLS